MWIELHDTLSEHPKTEALAQALCINQAWAMGILAALWTWAIRNAPDGDLSRVSDKALARACFWERKPALLADALTRCGWLDADRAIHHWQDYAGRLLAKRAANAQRMRARRARTVPEPCAPCAPPTVPDPTVPDPTQPDPTQPHPTQPAHTQGLFPDDAWRTSARARGAVAQRVVDRLRDRGCDGPRLYDVVEEYLALGLPPDRMIGFSALSDAQLSASLFALLRQAELSGTAP